MTSLSVVIITFNEEDQIGDCIDSVKLVADEIIILDSLSTDRTAEIATQKGAKVFLQPFAGYVAQKNKALEFASNDFVLSLDADERLDSTLSSSIIKAKQNQEFRAYRMNRCANYCGKFIRHGSWYPEPKIRLFDRRIAKWEGDDPHDFIALTEKLEIGKLKGDILHYICDTVEEHRLRTYNFSTIAAKSLNKRGKKTNWLKIVASPTWFFFNDYIVRRGFLSGYYGWKIATIQAHYHFLKYAKLYKLQGER